MGTLYLIITDLRGGRDSKASVPRHRSFVNRFCDTFLTWLCLENY